MAKKCKVALLFLAFVLTSLLFTLIISTIFVPNKKYPWDEVSPFPQDSWTVDPERQTLRGQRLSSAVKIPTISWDKDQQNLTAFIELHDFIKKSFPLIHSSDFIHVSVVNNYSLLYEIRGAENGAELPYMLTGHLDVVPASESWTVDPFGGAIVDNVIYGRGCLDDKGAVFSILEALEFLLEEGFVPKRSFFIGFGHDEELSGFEGAGKIRETLQSRGIDKLDFVLDEGFYVMKDAVPGVTTDIAFIGVTEKGYATLELSVTGTAGHSSIPPRETPLGILARAVGRLEEYRQPSSFGLGPEKDLFSYLAPHANFVHRLVYANLWLLSPMLQTVLSMDPVSDAIQRTTTAVTVFNSGYKSNVVPGYAKALVNHRIHPARSLEQVLEHDRKILGDPRINISVKSYYPPTPIAPYGEDVPQFSLIAETIKAIFPDTVIVPASFPANTDLRRYVPLTSNLYRFNPVVLTPKMRETIHGDDEHLAVADYHRSVTFFARFIVNAEKQGTRHKNRFSRDSEL